MNDDQRRVVRQLNDDLRRTHTGGRVMITCGVADRGPAFVAEALRAIAAFEAFDADNDPYEEHDFGALTVVGERLFWKVDYYDRSLTNGSPDPTDAAVTVRVLTVMLATEY